MNTVFGVTLRVFLTMAAAAVAATAVVGYLLLASVPDYDEDFTVPGIRGPVDILRDASAIPHISAASTADVYFALGFVHAQDRLGQMLRARRSAAAEAMRQRRVTFGRPVSAALDAYADGVNAWISELSRGGRGGGGPELLMLDAPIQPWEASDSLALVRAFLENLQIAHSSDEGKIMGVQVPAGRPNNAPGLLSHRRDADLDVWAVPASRTVSGAPILAADATGPLALPSQWYLADLQLPSGPVIGATLPGVPFVLIGRSENLAWGFRSSELTATALPDAAAEAFLAVLDRLTRSSSASGAVKKLADLPLTGLQLVAADVQAVETWPRCARPACKPAQDFRDIRRGVLDERQTIYSIESAVAVQQDVISAVARILLPLMAREMWFDAPAARGEGSTSSTLRSRVLDRLASWNGEMERLAPEPLVFWAWIRAFQQRILQDEYPAADHLWRRLRPDFLHAVLSDREGSAIWCDIRLSERRETCDEMLLASFDDALSWITRRYGDDPSSWAWGSEHVMVMKWSAIRPGSALDGFADLKAFAAGGPDTQKSTLFEAGETDPFEFRSGTNFQAVMTLGEDTASYFIAPAGQSGHPLSRFYDNLFSRWKQADYLDMSSDLSIARSAAAGLSRLTPLPRTNSD
ncbi:penicillin acylase family protein [Tranquillimonas alkanivorans]|uniref:Penicillin amidase n=1 Tax=Tranquillimonas alkanivorans TaxID=441119 RepID=A0A1I5TPR8_9RHOB|nr:penicillin acylase family protein [Tranquillimonas alkanivorans]SFP84901.1 penicillin amidase [Tranquillimonas alkanivorans]